MHQEGCIFCKIVKGEIPCAKVYESANALAFLDIAPVRPGHALVIPKAHYETLFALPADLAVELLEAIQRVGGAVLAATGSGGLNLQMNVYRPAGQLVDHAHFHLVPRNEGDGLGLWPQTTYATPEAMEELARAVRQQLS